MPRRVSIPAGQTAAQIIAESKARTAVYQAATAATREYAAVLRSVRFDVNALACRIRAAK